MKHINYTYRVKTGESQPWFIVVLDDATGYVEDDLPKIKERLRGRYGPSAIQKFTAVEYLGCESDGGFQCVWTDTEAVLPRIGLELDYLNDDANRA